MTQTRLRQTNWNSGRFWRFLYGEKPVFLKHLWNENFAYIPCISLRTRWCWLSFAGNSVICILFLDYVRFAIVRVISKSRFFSHKPSQTPMHGHPTKDHDYVCWYPLRRTVIVKCLVQEHNKTSPTALEPRQLDLETSALARGHSALLGLNW